MTLQDDFRRIQLSPGEAWNMFKGEGCRPHLVPDSESPLSHTNLVQRLEKRKFLSTDGHFGIGNVLMNLRMIAKSKQCFGILADGYPAQVDLFNSIVDMLVDKKNEKKQDFLKAFEAKLLSGFRGSLPEDRMGFFRNEIADAFRDEKDYQHLRALAKQGDLITLHFNLFDSDRANEVAGALKSSGRTLGTIYLTNLTWFLKRDEDFYRLQKSNTDIQRFWNNIKILCNRDQTLVCDAQHEERETMYRHYNTGCTYKDSMHHVLAGTCDERQARHNARRIAFASNDRLAFYRP